MRGWRPLLRFAWRDVRRAKGRSALVLVLIALPVLAVTMAATVLATQRMDGAEGLERRLGAADARIVVDPDLDWVAHGADPDGVFSGGGEDGSGGEPLTATDVAGVLDREVRLLELAETEVRVETDGGAVRARLTEVAIADPLTQGLASLEEGRWPSRPGEAFVNRALAEAGPGLGEVLRLQDGSGLVVVGVGEDGRSRTWPVVYTPPGGLDSPAQSESTGTTWLVDAGGPVTWADVRALNERGASVLSRAVMADPPARADLHPDIQEMTASDSGDAAAVAVLVVTMVLLEVVLLAGPAFAVTVRRQERTLALMSTTGGTPGQARLAILAIALVLGGLAVLLGLVGGVLLAWGAAIPGAQLLSDGWFGPFDVPWLALLAVAAFGLVAPVLAAVAPAWLASRLDVVAVLGGRRGEGAPSRRSPVVGLVLLAAGVAVAVAGSRQQSGGETVIAFAALLSVVGMVLLVPVVVAVLARLGRRLPLPVRYAVRDAARHRSRTSPAIAAVAATVAGVVALGISTSSDAKEERLTYSPQLVHGTAVVSGDEIAPADWSRLARVVGQHVPDATVTEVTGVGEAGTTGEDPWDRYVEMHYRRPGATGEDMLLAWSGGNLGTMDLVADEVPEALYGLDAAGRAAADRALAQGRVVILTNRDVAEDRVRVRADVWDGETEETTTLVEPVVLPAAYVTISTEGYDAGGAAVQAILPPAVADDLGLGTAQTGLLISGTDLPEEATALIEEAVNAVEGYGYFYVERGYVDTENLVLTWVLASLGAILMLGGTLTATFLALNDARPDLATLAAVGAASRMRRAVAASYALVVGGVGAVLGALVGFVPGLAAAVPLTSTYGAWTSPGSGSFSVADIPERTGPFIDVPWLMIAIVVVGLPLLTALVVGLSARSRLPMVARVE